MKKIVEWAKTLRHRDLLASVVVFLVYFLTAKFAIFVYYNFNTSPALIWPPAGIALAAVMFGGYRMWVPIFLAQFLAVFTRTPEAYGIALIIAAGYAVQAVAGLFVLRRFSFEPNFDKLRNTLILLGVAFGVTMIEPAIATLAQSIMGTLTVSPLLNFGRSWGGGIFSILVFTSLIATWYPWKNIIVSSRRELVAAFVLLTAVNYFLFWTPYPSYFGITVIFILPAALAWFGFRFHPRWLTLAVFFTSVVGITGSIVARPTPVPINTQVLADQIYIGFVAAIFMVFVAVVEERRAAYLRLEQAYKVTSASDKAKNDFIAILAHELRNPLAPIVSSLELLRLEPQTDRSLETIKNAEDHTTMIRRLLDDLLDTARLSQEKFQLQREIFMVYDILDQSVASVKNFMRERGHTLTTRYPTTNIEVYADPVRVKQMIINLLNNAGKYTRSGGHIELLCNEENGELVVEVADNGMGIPSEKFAFLFEPFKQMSVGSMASSGLGVGLFLTKRLAEMHGGNIVVDSAGVDQGSRFTLRLPLVSPDRDVNPKTSSTSVVASSTKILIVDDNRAAVSVLDQLLKHYGHEVQTSYSGTEALDILPSFNPNVIFLDIGMPGMDGYEVARKVRSSGWNGSIVALTGYGQKRDRQESQNAGFDYHLVKPVTMKDILTVLGRMQSKEHS